MRQSFVRRQGCVNSVLEKYSFLIVAFQVNFEAFWPKWKISWENSFIPSEEQASSLYLVLKHEDVQEQLIYWQETSISELTVIVEPRR